MLVHDVGLKLSAKVLECVPKEISAEDALLKQLARLLDVMEARLEHLIQRPVCACWHSCSMCGVLSGLSPLMWCGMTVLQNALETRSTEQEKYEYDLFLKRWSEEVQEDLDAYNVDEDCIASVDAASRLSKECRHTAKRMLVDLLKV